MSLSERDARGPEDDDKPTSDWSAVASMSARTDRGPEPNRGLMLLGPKPVLRSL
jgi:hypothetical protein